MRGFGAVLTEGRMKMSTLEELLSIIFERGSSLGSIIWTNGCFDLFHAGHAHLLLAAERMVRKKDVSRSRSNFSLVVGVNSDESIAGLKGPGRPIIPLIDRVYMVLCHRSVAGVVVFEDDTPIKAIRRIRPRWIVKGADYAGKEVVGAEVAEEVGGGVVFVPLLGKLASTSKIEAKILGGKRNSRDKSK